MSENKIQAVEIKNNEYKDLMLVSMQTGKSISDTYVDVIVLNLLERLLEIEDIDEFIIQTLEDFELREHIDKYAEIIDIDLLKKFITKYFENE